MESLLDRIERIAKEEGITVTALERAIGASKGVLSRAINNKTDIQAKWLQLIVENYPAYSARWLLTGNDPMLHGTRPSSTIAHERDPRDIQLIATQEKALALSEEVNDSLRRRIRKLENGDGSGGLDSNRPRSGTAPPYIHPNP